MNKLETKRLKIAVRYLYKKTRKSPTETELHKFLLLIDLQSIKQRGKPIFGLDCITIQNIKSVLENINTSELELHYFSKKEIEIIDNAIERILNNDYTINLPIDEQLKDIFEGYRTVQEIKKV